MLFIGRQNLMMIIKPANEISQDIHVNVSLIFIESDQEEYTIDMVLKFKIKMDNLFSFPSSSFCLCFFLHLIHKANLY